MSLKERTFHATKWATVLNGVVQIGHFILQFLLAKMLGPEEFGLAARVLVVGVILDQASEFGFNSALIQRTHLDERHRSTAFFMNIALAAGFALLGIACLQGYMAIGGRSEFLHMAQFVMPVPLAMGVGHVQRALLIRRLEFRLQTWAQVLSISAHIGVAVGMAGAGYGAWSIIAGFYANYLTQACVYWFASDWRPGLLADLRSLKELISFGVYVAMSRLLLALTRGLDVLLIGALLGDVRAGLYSIGFKVGTVTVNQVAAVLNSVLFASFSRLQQDMSRMREAYLKALRYLAVTSVLPVVIAYGGVPVLPVLLGDSWEGVVPVARVLCFAAVWWGLGAQLMPPILTAAGRPQLRFLASVVGVVGIVPFLLAGMQFGLVGTCVGVAAFYAAHTLFSQWLIVRVIDSTLGAVVRRIADVFLAFCLSAAAVHGIERVLVAESALAIVGRGILSAAVASVVYLATLHVCDRAILREVLGTLLRVVMAKASRSSEARDQAAPAGGSSAGPPPGEPAQSPAGSSD